MSNSSYWTHSAKQPVFWSIAQVNCCLYYAFQRRNEDAFLFKSSWPDWLKLLLFRFHPLPKTKAFNRSGKRRNTPYV